jgi:Arc/MetJ-type ribon-helix-helix transcriptional regulator
MPNNAEQYRGSEMIRLSEGVQKLIEEKMASGKYRSEDELLRTALDLLDAEDEELRAIQDSLDDLDRGEEGVPLDEAFAQLRAKYNIENNG